MLHKRMIFTCYRFCSLHEMWRDLHHIHLVLT